MLKIWWSRAFINLTAGLFLIIMVVFLDDWIKQNPMGQHWLQ